MFWFDLTFSFSVILFKENSFALLDISGNVRVVLDMGKPINVNHWLKSVCLR